MNDRMTMEYSKIVKLVENYLDQIETKRFCSIISETNIESKSFSIEDILKFFNKRLVKDLDDCLNWGYRKLHKVKSDRLNTSILIKSLATLQS